MFGGTDRKQLARYIALSQVGLEMAAPALLGLGLDHWFGWGPWGVITGAVIGLVGGLAHLVHLSNKANEEAQPPSSPGGAPQP
jgi:F0F1-type ATP synthase assembly protein I